jgi:hypothetical protein
MMPTLLLRSVYDKGVVFVRQVESDRRVQAKAFFLTFALVARIS